MRGLNKIILVAALFAFAQVSAQEDPMHHHHHETTGYDDQGLEFDIYSDPNMDLTTLPREGVFEGSDIFQALSQDERFDLTYCPELQGLKVDASLSAEFVVFCISKGTELGPWNLSESQKLGRDGTLMPALDKTPRFGPVVLRAGQTLRLINLDAGENAQHRLHVFDKPCYHQPRLMTPALYQDGELVAAAYYDCPTPKGPSWDSEKEDGSSALYNHQTKQPFYLKVVSEEVL